uniref:Macaca fascicularis brain cDNA clone: QmoA-11920, similar to human bullous pemphigoid antigen 1, 230/240kDa (BPAG1),transcript variant 1, mRNA, RefSeq: NM_183380.1 n=1 Tax=Macaca fascicularis TaxID=9541 RepID=I7G8M0_MACFA|nr:unnamed protein product [Macaca fascicularis]
MPSWSGWLRQSKPCVSMVSSQMMRMLSGLSLISIKNS